MKIVSSPDIAVMEIFDDDFTCIIDYNTPWIDPLLITSEVSDKLYNNDPNKENILDINLEYLSNKINIYQYIIYPKTLEGLHSKIYDYRKKYGVPVNYGESCKLYTIYTPEEYYKIDKYKELINKKYNEWFDNMLESPELCYPFTIEL